MYSYGRSFQYLVFRVVKVSLFILLETQKTISRNLTAHRWFENAPRLSDISYKKMNINTIEKLLNSLELMATNLPTYQTEVGATADDLKEVSDDLANLTAIKNYAEVMEAAKEATNQIKSAVFNGKPTNPLGAVPTVAPFDVPFPPLKPGCLERFNKRVKRFKAAAGYTKEIGIALGIDEPASGGISPDLLVAALKVTDLGNYQFEAVFRKQGMSAMLIQYRVKGTEKWLDIKTALQSPVTVDVPPPATEGAAVQIEIRARLLDGNTPVGQWSPIYPLTVNP